MPRFRVLKQGIRAWLRAGDWSPQQPLPPALFPIARDAGGETTGEAAGETSRAALPEGNGCPDLAQTLARDPAPDLEQTDLVALVGPLFACLPEGPPLTDRAALALGRVLSLLREQRPEEARNVIRRFMWHMNEESGNIGWGIPEAFGEALAASRLLADEYARILFSYILNKEGDSTWCDHAPLRRSCYLAVERVMQAWPDLRAQAIDLLKAGANDDPDAGCRQLARDIFVRNQ